MKLHVFWYSFSGPRLMDETEFKLRHILKALKFAKKEHGELVVSVLKNKFTLRYIPLISFK